MARQVAVQSYNFGRLGIDSLEGGDSGMYLTKIPNLIPHHYLWLIVISLGLTEHKTLFDNTDALTEERVFKHVLWLNVSA